MIQSLTKEELLALLGAARRRRERDWLLILVTFWHGLRASEAIQLTRDSFVDGYLTVRRLKGSMKTRQELVSHENPLLDERAGVFAFAANARSNQRLFPLTRRRFGQLIEQYGAEAGLERAKCHPHVLKHTIAMFSIGSGIENVRQYLGHKSISSTGAYLKVSDADAARAVRGSVRL